MSVRTRLHLSTRNQGVLVRILQVFMALIFALGLWLGHSGITVNAGVGLLVTFLPAMLNRRYDFTMDIALVLWITVAMFLHAFGTVPLPALDFLSPYGATWWWDHMTHALSSSLVAGAAYATLRAFDEYTDAISMPSRFLFVYLLMFVMAFGVLWELLEFYISVVGALLGGGTILTQYGLDDTVLDLFYNTLGGVLVGVFGTAHLTGVSDELVERLELRSAE
ncbi:hypothetical protein AUR64_12305 [Haloprofundus marisrubri]|uniref:Membrane-spanning protein n=1 Tax=Haloprofundus marisrubri TaxID=1514971 RepID=A0A0W1RAR6_9EURY|nr:hypothetical protein [Haloprofundus marisrubri]KTG10346.1 hypothetical protein AUR64_12305 [Haloprofundus marisrubri]